MSAAKDLAAGSADSSFALLREGEGLRLRFVGAWTTRELARHDAALRRLDLQGARSVAVDLGACSAVDSAGAWVLERTFEDLRRQGAERSIIHCPPALATLVGAVPTANCARQPATKETTQHPGST